MLVRADVHNLRDHGNLTPCYLPSWYLSVDTQLFAVLPFLVLAASLNRYAGIGICTALLVRRHLVLVGHI